MNVEVLQDTHLPGDSPRSTPLMRAEGITVNVDGTPILRDVGITLHPGEVHGLVGPNGAGKSTLLRLLAGVIHPSSGAVLINGRDCASLSARQRARLLAMVPQDASMEVDLAVRTVVTLGRYAHRPWWDRWKGEYSHADYAAVTRACSRVGVTHLMDRSILSLSGGQRQLVLIAKLLAQEPRIALLDEPISSLDVGFQLHILGVLRAMAAEGVAVAVVLHDLNYAARFCDRITVLNAGAVHSVGSPQEVMRASTLESLYRVRSVVDRDPYTGSIRVTPLSVAHDEKNRPNNRTTK